MPADLFVRARRGFAAALLAAGLAGSALAQQTAPDVAENVAADPELEARVTELSHTLRCLVCQNQSIAESNAPLAVDLRNQVREQLAAGRSEADIIDYLVARYGDFVLYRPPFNAVTLLLWGGPAVLLVAGAGWLALRLRRRAAEPESHLDEAERERARRLLAGDTPSSEEPRS